MMDSLSFPVSSATRHTSRRVLAGKQLTRELTRDHVFHVPVDKYWYIGCGKGKGKLCQLVLALDNSIFFFLVQTPNDERLMYKGFVAL